MNTAWLCVVLNRNLCKKGIDIVTSEIKRLASESFVDFHLVEDEYGGDNYSFVKCSLTGDYMERFRASFNIVSVLDSYDCPVYLSDEEVEQFIESGKVENAQYFYYGDMVTIEGEGVFSGLKGVVIDATTKHSLVTFRFHTVSLQSWIENEDLVPNGTVFSHLKLPVTNPDFLVRRNKYPIIREEKSVSPGEPYRDSN